MEEKTLLTILLPNSFRETASTIHIDRGLVIQMVVFQLTH